MFEKVILKGCDDIDCTPELFVFVVEILVFGEFKELFIEESKPISRDKIDSFTISSESKNVWSVVDVKVEWLVVGGVDDWLVKMVDNEERRLDVGDVDEEVYTIAVGEFVDKEGWFCVDTLEDEVGVTSVVNKIDVVCVDGDITDDIDVFCVDSLVGIDGWLDDTVVDETVLASKIPKTMTWCRCKISQSVKYSVYIYYYK